MIERTRQANGMRGAGEDLEAAFAEHRPLLMGHCYRMLGSLEEADDAVQETMLRAFRARDGFEGRSSLRTWLYRIATRVCLDMIGDRRRRERPVDLGPPSSIDVPLVEQPADRWIEPMPDALVVPAQADPATIAERRQQIRIAYVAALQHLPARQRAALLLTEVIGWSAAEAAEILEMTVAAVNSALQRARSTLASRDLGPANTDLTGDQQSLVDRFVDAFERYDMDSLTALLRDDVAMCMPPHTLWLQGKDAVRAWKLGPGAACRGSRLVRTAANGMPAFGQYKPDPAGGPHRPWALVLVELDRDHITGLTYFLDTARLFPHFGLPMELP